MSKPFFDEKDFTEYKYHAHERPAHAYTRMCNEKLEKALGPVVYAKFGDEEVWWSPEALSNDTHQARLFDVREIERECEHPVEGIVRKNCTTFYCCECDKHLKAKWEIAE